MGHRINSLGVVTVVALAATFLALGFGMQRWRIPSGGDPGSTEASSGPGGSWAVTPGGDGQSSAAVGESGRDAAGGASQSSGIEPPAVGLDRNTEYVVEDGVIVPQRMVGPGTASGGAGTEPSVPAASPMDVTTAGKEQLTVPSGIATPVIDVPDQQVPGGQDAVTRAGTAEASPLQVPGN
jgi:hypothetical protein